MKGTDSQTEQISYDKITKNQKKNSQDLKLELSKVAINILTIAICSFALYEANVFKVPPEIVAVTETGSLFEKTPLDKANKTDPETKQWIADRIIEAFDYNFTNQSEHVTTISHNYTPDAAASLDSFINGRSVNGRYTESMLKRKVSKDGGVVKIMLADGISLTSGKVSNLAGWQGSTKGSLIMNTKSGVVRLGRYSITMVVVRADENENKDGLKIQSFQMEKLS